MKKRRRGAWVKAVGSAVMATASLALPSDASVPNAGADVSQQSVGLASWECKPAATKHHRGKRKHHVAAPEPASALWVCQESVAPPKSWLARNKDGIVESLIAAGIAAAIAKAARDLYRKRKEVLPISGAVFLEVLNGRDRNNRFSVGRVVETPEGQIYEGIALRIVRKTRSRRRVRVRTLYGFRTSPLIYVNGNYLYHFCSFRRRDRPAVVDDSGFGVLRLIGGDRTEVGAGTFVRTHQRAALTGVMVGLRLFRMERLAAEHSRTVDLNDEASIERFVTYLAEVDFAYRD